MTGLIAPDLMDGFAWSRPDLLALIRLDTARRTLWGSIPNEVIRNVEEFGEEVEREDEFIGTATRDFCDLCRRMTRVERLQLLEHSGRLMCSHCRDRLRETDYATFQAENDACHRAIDAFEAVYRPLTAKLPDTLDLFSEVYP